MSSGYTSHRQEIAMSTRVVGVLVCLLLPLPGFAGDAVKKFADVVNALARKGGSPAGNLIANGGFEEPVVQSGGYTSVSTGRSFAGWEVVGVPGGRVSPISGDYEQSGTRFNADEGRQWLDLTGDRSNSATGVQQSVHTQAGAAYELVFYVGNVSGGAMGRSSDVEVLVDNKSLGVARNDKMVPGRQLWGQFRKTFTALGDVTTIAFINRDPPGDNSNGLDNVSLTLASAADSAAPAPMPAPVPATGGLNIAGDYSYLGKGKATFTQTGDQIHGFSTWPPSGAGPHYEFKGRLVGNTITGEWYSIYAQKGWFRWAGQVMPNGDLDFAQSDDPIRSNINKYYLTKQH
jgi:hypothetical protein